MIRPEMVSGYVLIGGLSRRLGVDKAAYSIAGVPAADRMARALQEVCGGEVALVGRVDPPWTAFPTVPDNVSTGVGRSPLSGVLTALHRTRTEYALIVAADLWRMTTASLAVILRGLDRPDDGAAVDVAYAWSMAGRGQPLCAAWRVQTCLPVVRRHRESDDQSMFGVLADLTARPVPIDDRELTNINEPADLRAFLQENSDGR